MMRLDTDPVPWERRPGETRQAYAAFALYRDMGPHERSHVKVGREVGKNANLIHRWSRRWEWVARADAFDTHEDRRRRVELEKRRDEMLERHRQLGKTVVEVVLARLEGDVEGDVTALNPNNLNAHDVARLAIVGVKIERLSHELPTEHQQVTEPMTEARPDDDLARRILNDPELADLATRFFGRLTMPDGETHGPP